MTTTTTTTARTLAEVLAAIGRQRGELTPADLRELATLDRLRPVLVRCGGCRFTCPAQDAAHVMRAIDAAGDYVRDVWLPATA